MSTSSNKYFIHDGGGIGDIIIHHIRGTHGWQFIRSLKKENPDSEIRVLLTCINPQADELLKYNPFIDKVETYQWHHPAKPWPELPRLTRGYINISKLKHLKVQKPVKIFLSEEDTKQVCSIKRPYVFIHPFCGGAERNGIPIENYHKIVDSIIDKAGLNVVMVGGTYKKRLDANVINKEVFDYEREGFYNLVNKTNIRVSTKLAMNSIAFLGTWSCFIVPAAQATKNLILTFPTTRKAPNVGEKGLVIPVRPKATNFIKEIDQITNYLCQIER